MPSTIVVVDKNRFRDKSKNRKQPTSQRWKLEEHRKTEEQDMNAQGPKDNPVRAETGLALVCAHLLVLPFRVDVKKLKVDRYYREVKIKANM